MPSAPSPPPPSDARRALGRTGEDLACAHLERLGYAIVACNHRTRAGEIDVVACDETTLVFVEVKTRRGWAPGRAFEALHPRKREQVRAMARSYLATVPERPRRRECRFDAIGVTIDPRGRLVALEHLEAAF